MRTAALVRGSKCLGFILSFATQMFYFGQPRAGFFFWSDFFTASCQSPSILSMSGLGPGVFLFFGRFGLCWLRTLGMNPLCSCDWWFVHQTLSFGGLDCPDGTLAIVQLAIVPQEIVLPQVTMKIFTAHVVVDPHDPAFY